MEPLRTPKAMLIDRALLDAGHPPLVVLIDAERRGGHPWRKVAETVTALSGIRVTGQVIINWAREAGVHECPDPDALAAVPMVEVEVPVFEQRCPDPLGRDDRYEVSP